MYKYKENIVAYTPILDSMNIEFDIIILINIMTIAYPLVENVDIFLDLTLIIMLVFYYIKIYREVLLEKKENKNFEYFTRFNIIILSTEILIFVYPYFVVSGGIKSPYNYLNIFQKGVGVLKICGK
ncbi:hypothetical protein HZS_817 [Henneguya salminicola]|nr:hypothetical protein HZS_817 [Henneguya salminicola]